MILFFIAFLFFSSSSIAQPWEACVDPNHMQVPRPSNYSNVCVDATDDFGVCSYASNGSVVAPYRNQGCYDGDVCTHDICTFCDCSGHNNCTIGCERGVFHCGCVFLPIRDCCNFDLECNDNDTCTIDSCVLNACQHAPIANCCHSDSNCSDSDACTIDTCVNGTCINSVIQECCNTDQDCNDFNSCTNDTCVNHQCVFTGEPLCCVNDTQCDDGNACTSDSCLDNQCSNIPIQGCCNTNQECADQISCTLDTCVENQCVHVANDSLCPIASSVCKQSTCSAEVGCVEINQSEGLPCEDGNLCTTNETCCGGVCKSAAMLDCSDGDVCTRDECDPLFGCIHLCIDPASIDRALLGDNSFPCPCCDDCDCRQPFYNDGPISNTLHVTTPSAGPAPFIAYTQPHCVTLTLDQPIQGGFYFNNETTTKIRKCMCVPGQKACDFFGEAIPFLSNHAECVPVTDPHSILLSKRVLPGNPMSHLIPQFETLVSVNQTYVCRQPSPSSIDLFSNPQPSLVTLDLSFPGVNESHCGNCKEGYACVDVGYYGQVYFGALNVTVPVCLPLVAPGGQCLGNYTMAQGVGTGLCYLSFCNNFTCQPSPSCDRTTVHIKDGISLYSNCPSDGPLSLYCNVQNQCEACSVVPAACATIDENGVVSYIGQPGETCCSDERCPVYNSSFGSTVECQKCHADNNGRTFVSTHPYCNQDEDCCSPEAYCVQSLVPTTHQVVQICSACAIAGETCDGAYSSHTLESTAVCCPGFDCLNGRCKRQCECDADCNDLNNNTIDSCDKGVCCHIDATVLSPNPFIPVIPGSSVPSQECHLCQGLGSVLSAAAIFSPTVIELYGPAGLSSSSLLVLAKNGLVKESPSVGFSLSTPIKTGDLTTSQAKIDSLDLFNKLAACPGTYTILNTAYVYNGGSVTWNFNSYSLASFGIHFSFPHSHDTIRLFFHHGLTLSSGTTFIINPVYNTGCNIYWIVSGDLLIYNVSVPIPGTFIVSGKITVDVGSQPNIHLRGRLISTAGLVEFDGPVQLDACNCTDCSSFNETCSQDVDCCSGTSCKVNDVLVPSCCKSLHDTCVHDIECCGEGEACIDGQCKNCIHSGQDVQNECILPSDCCTGICQGHCCSPVGQSCQTTGECCAGHKCLGVCTPCIADGSSTTCNSDADCCSVTSTCQAGTCNLAIQPNVVSGGSTSVIACNASITLNCCGNAIIETGEACDLGAALNSDNGSSNCTKTCTVYIPPAPAAAPNSLVSVVVGLLVLLCCVGCCIGLCVVCCRTKRKRQNTTSQNNKTNAAAAPLTPLTTKTSKHRRRNRMD